MYQVTQDFIDNAKKHGRLLDIRLSFDGNVLNGEDVNSVEKEFEVVMLGTSSQKLTGEIVGRYDLTDSVIRVEIGIAYNEYPFSYVDYGFFIVKEHERVVGAKGSQDKTTFIAYDIMLNAHELYDVDKLGVTYPISVFNLYKAIATYIGTEVSETSVVNGNMMIEEDKYTNIENVTYRNVLDDLSATMGASIIVSKNKLLAKYANAGMVGSTNVDSLHENNMRSLSIKDKMKPINILNLTREDAHDNYPYPLNWETIPVNERSEIVIADNQIMDKRRDEYAPSLFNAIEGLSYTPFDSETYGVLYLEPLDTIEVVDMNEVSHVSLVTNNRLKFTSGIKETLTSELPSKLKDKYALVTDNERQSMRVYFLVDKQNGIIQGLVEELGEVKDLNAQLTIRVDEIDLLVQNTNNGNVIGNINPIDYMGWTGGSILLATSDLLAKYGLTGAMNFIPKQMEQSLSDYGASFTNNGSATSPFGYVVPTEKYSYRAKIQRFKPFTIDLLEFKDMVSASHKSTRYSFLAPQAYVEFTSTLDNQTKFVRLKFNISGVTPSDRLEITEMMFNRGLPKEYYISGAEAVIYAQTNFKLTDDKISAVVDEVKIVNDKTELNKAELVVLSNEIDASVESIKVVDGKTESNKANISIQSDRIDANVESIAVVDGKTETNTANIGVIGGKVEVNTQSIQGINGDIHNAGVEINALEGIKVYGKKFEIENESRNKVIFGVDTVEGQEQVSILGSIQSEGGEIAFDSNEKTIKIGSSSLKNVAEDGRLGIKGKGLVVGYETSDNNLMIRWGSPSGLGLFFASHNQIDTNLTAINTISVSNQTRKSRIGIGDGRLGTIYLQDQPDVASDIRYKSNVQDIDKDLLELVGKYIKPRQYETRFDDKLHFGYIAQDVEKALYSYSLKKYGWSEANEWLRRHAVLSKSESYLGLLYGEVAVLVDGYNRMKHEELENRIELLERKGE